MEDKNNKRMSKSLLPPEAILAGVTHIEDQPKVETVEISTPKKTNDRILTDSLNEKDISRTPDGMDAIDLNIVNLESTSDIGLDDRARSSPSFRDFGKDEEAPRRPASTGNLANAEDPEDRLGHGRKYSLDLVPTQDHVIIEIEQQRTRKANESKFKIIVGLSVFAILFSVTFFMMAWEMGYLKTSSSFSTPPILAMPPKTKKRRGAKESEEELLVNGRLTEVFFKYRQDDSSEEEEAAAADSCSVGMFEDEDQKIKLKDVEAVVKEVGIVDWDPAVLVLIDAAERASGLLNMEKMKILIMTLLTVERQMDDIEYLFKTFSDPQTKQITHDSLCLSLKHLSIRESPEKTALLLAFAHEQPFLQLVVNEQTTGQPMSLGADRSGVAFDEFKRTFIRSTFLANK